MGESPERAGEARRYTILLDPNEEGGDYTVTVPALPGMVTQRETVEECRERAGAANRAAHRGAACPRPARSRGTLAPQLTIVSLAAQPMPRRRTATTAHRRGARSPLRLVRTHRAL